MNLNIWATTSIVSAALSSLSFLVVYGLGSRWWVNAVGRSVIIQSSVLSSVVVFSAVRRTLHPVPLPHASVWPVIVFFAVIALAELQRSATFALEIYRGRHRTVHVVEDDS